MGIRKKERKKTTKIYVVLEQRGHLKVDLFLYHILTKVDLDIKEKFETFTSNLDSGQCVVVTCASDGVKTSQTKLYASTNHQGIPFYHTFQIVILFNLIIHRHHSSST
jgi:hypothetical protein